MDHAAAEELVGTLRHASSNDAVGKAMALMNGGVRPQSIWDALFVASRVSNLRGLRGADHELAGRTRSALAG